jgi:2-keto-4-pentenoate hydratase
MMPRPQAYSVQEVMRRVASLHPAIELPDSRFERYESVGAPQLIADNACAHDFLLGPPSTDAWRFMDLAAHEVWGTVNDAPARLGVGRNVLGDPRTALTWLVNELSCYGVTLRAGEIVSAGTCLVPLGIALGDRVRGDFGILGQVAISIL